MKEINSLLDRVIRLGIPNLSEYLMQATVTTSTKRRKKHLIKIHQSYR